DADGVDIDAESETDDEETGDSETDPATDESGSSVVVSGTDERELTPPHEPTPLHVTTVGGETTVGGGEARGEYAVEAQGALGEGDRRGVRDDGEGVAPHTSEYIVGGEE
ncbi:MAG: hypothetical protein ABEH80_01065, partial [Halobaculum sp.]